MGSRLNILHLSDPPRLPGKMSNRKAPAFFGTGSRFTPTITPLDPGPAKVSPLHAMGLNSVELLMAVERESDVTPSTPWGLTEVGP